MAWIIEYTDTAKQQLSKLDRVICDIQDAAVRVLVVRIGNRKNVYR